MTWVQSPTYGNRNCMYVTLLKHWRATSAKLPQRETTFPTNFLNIPAPACAVEEAGETIQGAQIEEGRGLALYLRLQELFSDTMGHDGEVLSYFRIWPARGCVAMTLSTRSVL